MKIPDTLVLATAWILFATAPGAASGEAPADFDYAIDDGLYATLTGYTSLRKTRIPGEQVLGLDGIEGFRRQLTVRVVPQDGPAPLVLLLLGLETRVTEPLARFWIARLHAAGYHVLTFDSVFRPGFSRASGHGVAGNVDAEAEAAGRVLAAFLAQPGWKDRVTGVGVVGLSYGGTVALNLARQADEGKAPVVPDRVIAFSPPVSLRTSAGILDRCRAEDLPRYGLLKLAKLRGEARVAAGRPIPFEESLIRAGLGYSFGKSIRRVAEEGRGMLDAEARRGLSRTRAEWSFTGFVEEMSFRYWKERGEVSSVEELWAAGDLERLVAAASPGVHVYLAADDPLNDPAEFAEFAAKAPAGKVTVLPRGGHMGYQSSGWARACIEGLFPGVPVAMHAR